MFESQLDLDEESAVHQKWRPADISNLATGCGWHSVSGTIISATLLKCVHILIVNKVYLRTGSLAVVVFVNTISSVCFNLILSGSVQTSPSSVETGTTSSWFVDFCTSVKLSLFWCMKKIFTISTVVTLCRHISIWPICSQSPSVRASNSAQGAWCHREVDLSDRKMSPLHFLPWDICMNLIII